MPGVTVVQRGITTEKIAIAVPTTDTALLGRINVAQATLEQDGTLPAIRERWTGSPRADQSGPGRVTFRAVAHAGEHAIRLGAGTQKLQEETT